MTGEHGVEREERTVEWVLRQRKNWWFSLNNGCSLKSGPVGGGNLREQTCFHTLLLTAFSVRLDVEITEVI